MISETEKTIVKILTPLMNREDTLGVMSLLRIEKAEMKMLDFLKENPDATGQEIMIFAHSLRKMKRGI